MKQLLFLLNTNNSNNINTELAMNILFEIHSVVVHISSDNTLQSIYLCDSNCVYNTLVALFGESHLDCCFVW